MGPHGSKNFKTLLLQINFSESSVFITKVLFWIFEILSLRFFKIFFEKFKLTTVPYGETKSLFYLGKGAIVEQN